jgi:hypothetical protein
MNPAEPRAELHIPPPIVDPCAFDVIEFLEPPPILPQQVDDSIVFPTPPPIALVLPLATFPLPPTTTEKKPLTHTLLLNPPPTKE